MGHKWGAREASALQRQQVVEPIRVTPRRAAHAGSPNLAVWEYSVKTRALRISEQWGAMLGLAPMAMVTTASELRQLVHPEDRATLKRLYKELLAHNLSHCQHEFRVRTASDDWLWVAAACWLVADERTGELSMIAGTVADFATALPAALQPNAASVLDNHSDRLREVEQRFRDVVDAAGEYVWEIDQAGRYTFVSQRVTEVLGYTPDELIGRKPSEFMPAAEVERVLQWSARRTHKDGPFRDFEHQSVTKAGDTIWQSVSGVPFTDAGGNFAGYRGTGMDITLRKLVEARYQRLATHDALTGLANRTSLQERLTQEIQLSARSGRAFAMLFIDLDRFKVINDTLGHAVGDALLQEVAKRLHACLRGGDLAARVGGDEFVIGLFSIAHPEHAGHVARKVLEALSQPCVIDGHTLNTGGSVGIAVYPDDGNDMDTLMKHGDVAMYHAKQLGRNRYEFYTPELNLGALERLQLENELRVALNAGQFVLHYQPRVDTAGRVQCVEALIRWQHPTRGLLAADKFIQVAEDMGLIGDIGRWVLTNACRELSSCAAARESDIKLAVNLSPTELRGQRDFAAALGAALGVTQFDPTRLELEITETSLVHPSKGDLARLNECRALGVEFAIDDFGTGYSSLGYLQQLPVQTLKIDRSFVANPAHRPIVEAILSITQKFKLQSVAEGIETHEQYVDMCKLGCSQLQGYYICAPVPLRALPRALADLAERARAA
jgi:diguanylate cyclase (GGDEF)-like protein/PAS domain S-box-containing protein